MRTAIFGGTFDPIHSAHLLVAREAADTFALDRVLFIPSGNPPLKEARASYQDRFRMTELACAADSRFIASNIEAGAEKSYSIHTIERVKAENGDVFFIIGTRPGHFYTAPEGARVHRLETLALPVSSSEIRLALARGQSPAALPKPVLDYIRANGLYGAAHSAGAIQSDRTPTDR
jgi:nicotinate-nucleotide adenylyltransferase